jgi:hypothetical protein
VHAVRAREKRLRAAQDNASRIAGEIKDAKDARRRAGEAHARLVARAPRVYADPKRAIETVIRFGREHGESAFNRAFHLRWEPAGRLRGRYRKDWLGWLGFTDTKEGSATR